MIRINLLEETRVASKAKGGGGISMPSFQVAENVPLFILGGGFLVAVAVVAVLGMNYKIEKDQLDEKIRIAEKEKARLQFILKKNEELEAKKAELQRRIGIIEELKSKQDVPVRMLDQISQNLADSVWLEDLTFAGEKIDIRGWAQTPLAYSGLLRNLEDSNYFLDETMGVLEIRKGLTRFRAAMKFNPSGVLPSATPPGGAGTPAALSSSAPKTSAGAK